MANNLFMVLINVMIGSIIMCWHSYSHVVNWRFHRLFFPIFHSSAALTEPMSWLAAGYTDKISDDSAHILNMADL